MLFHSVLRLVSSCAKLVGQEINSAGQSGSSFSLVHRIKLRRAAVVVQNLGIVAWMIEQSGLAQDQRAIRGGRLENNQTTSQNDLSITTDEEHAIASKPHGDARV